jgi:hypothetical protein
VEGLHGRAKLSMRNPRGHKSFDVAQIALFHTPGRLPSPESHNKFW